MEISHGRGVDFNSEQADFASSAFSAQLSALELLKCTANQVTLRNPLFLFLRTCAK